MFLAILPVAVVLAAAPVTAGAEPKADQRFQIVAVADGVVRLDTVTGAMTHCRDQGDGFSCKLIGTEPSAAIARPALPKAESKDSKLEDFDQALGMMERAMKSFMAIAGDRDKSCAL